MKSGIFACSALAALASLANANVVFQNSYNNGFFVPFNSSTPANVRYGDSGWLSNFTPSTYTLTSITLGLAVFGSTAAGSTDLTFTFNDGDPSGLVFGPGTTLYATTVTNVSLPDTSEIRDHVALLAVTIPLPGVVTSGGFNNIGWSVGVSNFRSDGAFGFQCSSAFGQSVGFYTSNASYNDGSSWSLFSFGTDPVTGVANFVATVQDNVPSPGAASVLIAAGLLGSARRRR